MQGQRYEHCLEIACQEREEENIQHEQKHEHEQRYEHCLGTARHKREGGELTGFQILHIEVHLQHTRLRKNKMRVHNDKMILVVPRC